MKSMSDYTLYCTPEQTKRAYKLGAPIETYPHERQYKGHDYYIEYPIKFENFQYAKSPTAEQMIEWILQEKNILCDVFPADEYRNPDWFGFRIGIRERRWNKYESDAKEYKTRKEATLAAIDAALEYLEKGEKK